MSSQREATADMEHDEIEATDTDTTETATPDTGTPDTGTADTDSATTTPEDAGRSVWRRLRAPILWALIGALIVTLAGLSLFFWLADRQSQQVFDQQPAVLNAAREGTTAVLSYRASAVDADVAAAQQRLTGGFAEEYRTLAAEKILPAAKERGVSSSVNISGVSLMSSTADEAEVLVFVTQKLQTADPGEPTTTATAMRVGLVNKDGRWLIDRLAPI